jgi:hypothetical protein
MSKMLQELEAERAGLEARRDCVSGANLSLHPNMIPAYLQAVHELAVLLNEGEDTAKLRSAFRNMVYRIEVKPTGKRMPYKIEAFGRQSTMLGMNFFPAGRSKQEILETEGLSRVALAAIPEVAYGRSSHTVSDVISLGVWQQAA